MIAEKPGKRALMNQEKNLLLRTLKKIIGDLNRGISLWTLKRTLSLRNQKRTISP